MVRRIKDYDFTDKQDYVVFVKKNENHDFVEDQDFLIIHNSMNNSKRGPKFKEYTLSIDMGKELSVLLILKVKSP